MSAVLYEVSIKVSPDLCEAFESFMIETHVPEVMATGVFSQASLAQLSPGHYRVSYTAPSRKDLEGYLDEQSPRLRGDVKIRFPEGLEFSREVWSVLAVF